MNNRKNKKTVSFREVGQGNHIREYGKKNTNINRGSDKKVSILKARGKKSEKKEELENEKVMEEVKPKEKVQEIKQEEKEIKIKKEEEPSYNFNYNPRNKMSNLSSDEYLKATVQSVLEQGLLNMAMLHPSNPIKFLGNYLLEKSKEPSSCI